MVLPKAFNIIFNDEYLLAINKIAKIVVIATPKREKYTLTSLLRKYLQKKVFPCHRLDRETTGIIIYAKSENIQNRIANQFRQGIIEKKYFAFVRGKMRKTRGVIDDYIIDREGKKFGEKPKKAITLYRIIKTRPNFSIVELSPRTGRTNQLRIQLAKLGNPILGESKYAFRRDFKLKFKRLALHAYYINFVHPVSNQVINLKIDLAEDMRIFLKNNLSGTFDVPDKLDAGLNL